MAPKPLTRLLGPTGVDEVRNFLEEMVLPIEEATKNLASADTPAAYVRQLVPEPLPPPRPLAAYQIKDLDELDLAMKFAELRARTREIRYVTNIQHPAVKDTGASSNRDSR